MKDKNLMKLMIDCPSVIRDILLTDHQINIVKTVRGEWAGVTTKEIADTLLMSVTQASGELKTLYDMGYLTRAGETAFIYRCAL